MPRVSVVMPVFNAASVVADAVDSVLQQSFGDVELIVVDDGSTDGTASVLARFDDPRLRVVALPANAGIAVALNHGMSLATGDLLARMDGDDIARGDRLERQVAAMDADPSIGVSGSWVQALGRPGLVFRQPLTDAAIRARLQFGSAMFHPTVMVRRSVLADAFEYDPAWVPVEDYELWTRLARNPSVRFMNLPETLLEYRLPSPSRVDYAARQRRATVEVAVREAQRAGRVGDDVEARGALQSLVLRAPPEPGGWATLVDQCVVWSAADAETAREVAERWALIVRKVRFVEIPAMVRGVSRRSRGRAAVAAGWALYGVVRRRRWAEGVVEASRRVRARLRR